jgi:hypothetical protein
MRSLKIERGPGEQEMVVPMPRGEILVVLMILDAGPKTLASPLLEVSRLRQIVFQGLTEEERGEVAHTQSSCTLSLFMRTL